MEDQAMVNRSIYLPAQLAEAIDKLAKADSRTFNGYVRLILEAHIGKTELEAIQRGEAQPETRPA